MRAKKRADKREKTKESKQKREQTKEGTQDDKNSKPLFFFFPFFLSSFLAFFLASFHACLFSVPPSFSFSIFLFFGDDAKGADGGGVASGAAGDGGGIFSLSELSAPLHQNITRVYRASTKPVCVTPPRFQGGTRHLQKRFGATSGCTWVSKRTIRSGSFPLDIWGVSRNGVFSEKTGFR